MAIFSRPNREAENSQGNQDSRDNQPSHDTAPAGDTEATVEAISPLAFKMQERQHKLDNLKVRLGILSGAFEQISGLAAQSENSINSLSEFIETSKANLETETRLKSENAKLATELLESSHRVETLTTQLQESDALVHSLRQRGTGTRTALETARNDIVSIRDNNKKLNEEYTRQSAELVDSNSSLAEVSDQFSDLQTKYSFLVEQADNIRSELEYQNKRESELQQQLSENTLLLEEEISKNKKAVSDLEALRREFTDVRNENIDLTSKLESATHELEYNGTRMEDIQRKHDNETFSLRSEIENLSSKRRIEAQALKDISQENKTLKERNRDANVRLHEIEQLLDAAQKKHDNDREELLAANTKLHEINLRYNSVLTDLNHEKRQNEKYAKSNEILIEEHKKLADYKMRYETATDQIRELKSLISNYQLAMGKGSEIIERSVVTHEESAPEMAAPEVEDKSTPQKPTNPSSGTDGTIVIKLRD